MANIRKHVFLDRYLKKYDAEIWSETSSLFHLKPLINLKLLMKKLKTIPGVVVYSRAKLPDHLHYRNSSRIGDILIHANEGVALLYMRNEIVINGTEEYAGGYAKLIKDSAKAK